MHVSGEPQQLRLSRWFRKIRVRALVARAEVLTLVPAKLVSFDFDEMGQMTSNSKITGLGRKLTS